MGHGHDGALVLLQEPFEPGHRLGVEVVRGLVEEQKVGGSQQQPAERDAAPFASRERRHVGVGRRQPEGVHRQLDARVQIPPAGRFDSVLDPALLLEDLVHLLGREVLAEPRVDLVVALEQRLDVRDPLLDVAEHVLRRIEPRLLVQHADRNAAGGPRLAQERLVLARHDAEQRTLARPVEAEHANLRAVVEGEPDVLQHDVVRGVDLPQTFHGVDEFGHKSGLQTADCTRHSALLGRSVDGTLTFGSSGVKSSPGLMNRSDSRMYCLS